MSSAFGNYDSILIPSKPDKFQIRPRKGQEMALLTEDLKKFETAYVFSYKDVRRSRLENIAKFKEWGGSKIWYGRNKLIQETLLNVQQHELEWPDVDQLSAAVRGQRAILLTNRSQKRVEKWFDFFSFWDYPQPGFQVDVTIKLRRGPLTQFKPKIEPFLRKLGMPTAVLNGTVMLTEEFRVCKAGTRLWSKEVRLLELLGEKLTVHKLHLLAKWSKHEGFQVLNSLDESAGEEELSDNE